MPDSSTRPADPEHLNKKVLVLAVFFKPSGGGDAVTANVVEALKRNHTVTMLTWEPVDVHAINRVFGTSIRESDLEVVLPPRLLRAIIRFPNRLLALRWAILLRLCKKIRNNYDVIISVNNEADFGCKGIQYVHDPPYWLMPISANRTLARELQTGFVGNLIRNRHRPWMVISGFSHDRMKANSTLVNSDWTGRKLKETYGRVANALPTSRWTFFRGFLAEA
jgi:hypothetical protein